MDSQESLLRLTVAALLGSFIGLERHRADKAAGMRTHMLVSVGSALFMIVSAYGFDAALRPSRVTLDPSRVAAQVVSGIGFLGAGTILRRNETVLGLTTAASIWAVAAVGLAAGGGRYLAAAAATGLILFILAGITPLEDRVAVWDHRRTFTILLRPDEVSTEDIENVLRQAGMALRGVRIRRGDDPDIRRVVVTVGLVDEGRLWTRAGRLQSLEGVREASYDLDPRST